MPGTVDGDRDSILLARTGTVKVLQSRVLPPVCSTSLPILRAVRRDHPAASQGETPGRTLGMVRTLPGSHLLPAAGEGRRRP